MPAKTNPGAITPAAELKPLLHLARRQPLNCAIAMDRDKQGHILLHRRTKPKKLLAELKRQAKAAGIDLDPTTLRFGRASVDGSSDSGMVTFTVNKPAPGPMRRALLDQVRPAGLQRCEIVVDEGLENEPEDDGEGADDSGGAAHGAAQEIGGTGGSGNAGRLPPEAAADGGGQGGPAGGGPAVAPSGNAAVSAGAGAAGTDAAAGDPPAPASGGQDGTGAPDAASLHTRLAGLLRRTVDQGASNPAGADTLKAAATAARNALVSGDLAGAGRGADVLQRLLDGLSAGTAAASGPAPATPVQGTALPGPQGAPTGRPTGTDPPTPSGAPGRMAADGPAPVGAGAGLPAAQPGVSAGPAGSPGGVRHGVGHPVFDKGRVTWEAVRAKLQGDIDAALKGMVAMYGADDPRVGTVHRRVEPIMKQLDDSLAAKLGEVAGNTAPDVHAGLVREAEAIIERYRAFVDGEPMIAGLDQNPFHPMMMRKTLDAALLALSKVVAAA